MNATAQLFAANRPPAAPTQSTRRKPRAVVFGSGIGMFPPLMQRFQEEFEIVAALRPTLSTAYHLACLLLSIRWPRDAWYRRWRRYLEKTPASFRALTRISDRQLRGWEGKYDVILFMGAMYAPTMKLDKPLFVFTDSCRWLSARNPHDEISHFRNAGEEAAWLTLEREVYRSASRIFVGSDFVRRALLEQYGVAADKAVVSGFGAGIGFGEPYDKVLDGRSILYIGKGDFEKKGGIVLMRAFEQVRREIPDAQLHVVGQDRLPETPGVVNHGFVRDRQKIAGLMRTAHVFALPSLVDRNPITILEAMAASTPCVASDYGAMPDLVGDAGIIAPCNDVDALAAALISILRDPDLSRRLGAAGRRRFEEKYNWDSIWNVIRAEMRSALSS
jgi:glycosyltransferase involved in cell wall biosynthesis